MKTYRIIQALVGLISAISTTSHAAPPFAEFIDPNPNPGNQFGAKVVPLSTGNVVITSPLDDAGGTDAGAVYLFNGATGALISTLIGSTANDRVGWFGVIALSNGNYLVLSPLWDQGSVIDAGAVTWCNGTSGLNGVVSSGNSLVGSTNSDQVGGGDNSITILKNGNYLVRTTSWDNGAAVNAGAVTWGSSASGISGIISASNSLVGSSSNDFVGNGGIKALSNGNYVVSSPSWANGAAFRAGAVTWGNGLAGVNGVVSSSNSLVGNRSEDSLSDQEIIEVGNSNYIVRCRYWDNGTVPDAGAITWGSGSSGVSGSVTSGNSLVGTSAYDQVGDGALTVLANGNYVAGTRTWDLGNLTNVGAATWGHGNSGVIGAISSANSLIGSAANDRVGWAITGLSNGNYVVNSQTWSNGSIANAGAVTWGNGMTGINGTISSTNSLVGATTSDRVGMGSSGLGDGVKSLPNGNYVVISHLWDNGPVVDAGAVTWGNGNGGTAGVIGSSNSLVGTTTGDKISDGVLTVLTNGNYVIRSTNWDNGPVVDAGAVTWGNGAGGTVGAVTALNSLVGSSPSDKVGLTAVVALSNGHYVVSSRDWDNAGVANAGAVTWGNGSSGISGPVSAANSLVGTKANDQVGSVTALSNGNYVVRTNNWDNGFVVDVGAVTWGNGSGGTIGPVSSGNSLIGNSQGDRIGDSIIALPNGNYVVGSSGWNNASIVDAGAVTWGSGTSGVSGAITTGNSLYGSRTGDGIGAGSGFGIVALTNGNFLVRSTVWDNGAIVDAGSVTWGSGITGLIGPVSSGNSLVGLTSATNLQAIVVDEVNNTFFGRFLDEGGGKVRVGSLVSGIFVVPSVVAITPASGITIGGTHVTINGTGLTGVTSVTIGGVAVTGLTVSSDTSISATTGARSTGTVDVVATTPAGSGTGVGLFTYVTAQAAANTVIAAAGLTEADAEFDAVPFDDGVENLLKYAFNMNLAGPDSSTMAAGGNAGLPTITTPDAAPAGTLRFEFLRRKGSGLVYTPQKSTTLDGPSWSPLTASPVVTSIDDQWERVVYTEAPDPIPAPACFGRVSVTLP